MYIYIYIYIYMCILGGMAHMVYMPVGTPLVDDGPETSRNMIRTTTSSNNTHPKDSRTKHDLDVCLLWQFGWTILATDENSRQYGVAQYARVRTRALIRCTHIVRMSYDSRAAQLHVYTDVLLSAPAGAYVHVYAYSLPHVYIMCHIWAHTDSHGFA